MFRELQLITERPAAFSKTTTAELWTDPYISEQMLRFHLDGSVAISSGTTDFIEAAIAWMNDAFNLAGGARVLDLGCGPGLYANRLAKIGADVTGVDFSSRSIAYACEAARQDGLQVTYFNDDYLAWEPDRRFDLITMIMRDYCALAPERRLALLRKIERLLEREGSFLFDVNSPAGLERAETSSFAAAPEGGFWSPDAHFEFHSTYVYPPVRDLRPALSVLPSCRVYEDGVVLDKHVVVEESGMRIFYDWAQCFSPEGLTAELGRAGLEVASVLGDVAGRPFDPQSKEFAVVARRRSV